MDSADLDCLTSERLFLETKMEILNAANERLLDFLTDHFNKKKQELSKIEASETEHSDALRRINERIAKIKQDTGVNTHKHLSPQVALLKAEGSKQTVQRILCPFSGEKKRYRSECCKIKNGI